MTVPLPSPSAPPSIRVLTWNIWCGGREVAHSAAKQIDVLRDQCADIVLLQEAWEGSAAPLAAALDMGVAQQGYDNAVLSPHPARLIATGTDPYASAAIVSTFLGEVLAWSVHLAPWDYGPYRHGASAGEKNTAFGAEREVPGEEERAEQIRSVLTETERILAGHGEMPVIIAGDFNVPSPQDWNGHHRPDVAWPATQILLDAGYADAFRDIHPDPGAAPGLTWAQIHTLEDEPRDRIDFIFTRGLTAVAADHYGSVIDDENRTGFTEHGGSNAYIPHHADNAFPSDHLAVRAALAATPVG
ncbi:endonuclease/exonuclease/phosphatase family protein [Microbacterium amylolyticum]|uniref:Endonuclease/exonuclease/phosphatase family metal-dependent hydrolase n=1 Tax=Microbacterium amylolyticum TaxID=936337 RepID=A0ABS4ZDP2_9MICO|nr:endonuclease/exonuclease/phosphatase family protein [Microbacterium amylolyticum]MBP2435416.1 endonuclease/exonuclease/phosphatase family metal-dependent hydrolase [Microbacterium amylolyticum]